MKKIKFISLLLLAGLIFMLASCSDEATEITEILATTQPISALEEVSSTAVNTVQTVSIEQPLTATAVPISIEYDNDDLAVRESNSDTVTINLADDATTFTGDGVVVEGSIVTITAAGTYSISGTLNDGQLMVDTQDEETVMLILNGVNITNTTSAPIYVSNAEKAVITLADGTENVITDGVVYVFSDAETDEPNAALFSKDDLTINGTGSLIVNANYNNGIASKDDLKITGGTITITAVNDGIKGRDSIAVLDGLITVNAGGNGLQSNNDEDAEKGYVSIEGGTLSITAVSDGIQAETVLNITDGNLTVISGGGSTYTTADSAKGLKAGGDLIISGGTITVDAADDAIHANGSITINGGDIVAASADDGVHADTSLTINDGNLTISQSYEGLESGVIIINEGVIHLVSSDDGVNVTSGDMGGGESVAQGKYFEINGGYLVLDAGGDGLDSNGSGTLNGGVVLVNGPTENRNGALDVNGTLTINGGFLVAVGSAGMAQSPGTASTQYSVLVTLPTTQLAGSMIHIESEAGEEVLTFVSTKSFETAVFSSPALENGTTYLVYTGGSSTGTATDGLFLDGTYTPGNQVSSFTITSIVTGESTGMSGPRGGGRP